MTKLATIDLKGKAYATVPTRIKEFREACPNGDIQTKPEPQPDGHVIFKAYIIKDKNDEASASATGHSIGKVTGEKAFEKLETIAVGRALALLGYMASGEIASSEEMEEFLQYRTGLKQEAIDEMKKCETQAALKKVFVSLGSLMADADIIKVKDEMKAKLK